MVFQHGSRSGFLPSEYWNIKKSSINVTESMFWYWTGPLSCLSLFSVIIVEERQSSLHWRKLKGKFWALCQLTWISNIMKWMFPLWICPTLTVTSVGNTGETGDINVSCIWVPVIGIVTVLTWKCKKFLDWSCIDLLESTPYHWRGEHFSCKWEQGWVKPVLRPLQRDNKHLANVCFSKCGQS